MMSYVERVSESVIFNSFQSATVTAIIGARRVGKSTLVAHYSQLHPEYCWVQFNLDYRSQRIQIREEKLQKMIEETAEKKIGSNQKIWVIIDEVQKCEEVFDQVKILYDKFKGQDKIKFILTGSGQLSLRKHCAETLAGRIEIHDLREFNLHEQALISRPDLHLPKNSIINAIFSGDSPDKIDNLVNEIAPLQKVYDKSMKEELVWGGLPECLEKETKDERITYLRNYIDTYFEKDIRVLGTITDLDLYQRLMKISAEQTGSVRDDQKVLEALGCSRETLKKYRGYLYATMMYQEIYPFIGNTIKRIIKSPKGYLMNNGLISYFTGIYDLDILESSGQVGHRFENFVLKQLETRLDQSPKQSKIFFYYTHGGFEVDFIIDHAPIVYAVEVTYGKNPKRSKQQHLRKFLQEERATTGLYIYNGPYNYDSKDNIFYLPAWTLF